MEHWIGVEVYWVLHGVNRVVTGVNLYGYILRISVYGKG